MRLAVSNIGWTAEADARIGPLLTDAGADALEVAPGRIFADIGLATEAEARQIGQRAAASGLPIVSMQALLFGREDLTLFGDAAAQAALIAHLDRIAALAGALGCGPMVFGAPRNRLKGARSLPDAMSAAAPVLQRLGAGAAATGTCLCLEANAEGYGCDFLTRLDEAAEMVARTAHPGLRLVADTGNMLMAGDGTEALARAMAHVAHVHVSAPQLGPVEDHAPFITEVVAVLADQGYDGIVTLEMRPGAGPDPLAGLLRGVALLRGLIDGAGHV